jgi:Zn-dependent protease with chaperone function
MPFEPRRIVCGALVAIVLFAAGFAVATAAAQRPNQLDRRVDAISDGALSARPAVALVDSARQTAAERRSELTLPGWALMAVFEAIALAYFWSSGGAAALRERLRRRFRAEWMVRFAFGAALALIARLAALIPAFYLYRVERVMDLSLELTRVWALFWIAHTLLAMIVAGVIVSIVMWLVDRTHQWYAYTIVIILGASIAWSYASPLFEVPGSGGLQSAAGEVEARVGEALARGGVPAVPVLVANARSSSLPDVVVVGLGPFRRVVLARALVAGSTVPEIVYEVTYQIGHVIHADPLFFALIEGGIIIIFSALAVVLADRVRFRRDDDPLSRLALVGALLAVVYLAAVPVRNAALRSYDLDADRYAVALTGDRAAAVRAIVRAADQRMEEACPEMLPGLFLDAHPSPAVRVAAINGVPTGCP